MNDYATETQSLRTPRTGPVGRAVRLLLAAGFTYALATVVDQGGPASVRDTEALTDPPYVVLTIAMVAVYTVLISELAKLVGGEAVAKTARTVALSVLAAVAAAAAIVGELRTGAMWGSPLSDLVWTLDVAMLVQTIVALLVAVVLGTGGCEIGVWADIASRLRGGPASPPLCIIGLHHLDEWELRRRSRRRDRDERRPETKGRATRRDHDRPPTPNGKGMLSGSLENPAKSSPAISTGRSTSL